MMGNITEQAIQVLDYLNLRAGRRFKPAEPNLKLIKARLKEKNTIEELMHVVDNKCAEWIDTDLEKYLRPATLFNATKYYQYDGQPTYVKKTTTGEIYGELAAEMGVSDIREDAPPLQRTVETSRKRLISTSGKRSDKGGFNRVGEIVGDLFG